MRRLVKILALLCVGLILLAAIAAVPGFDFALLVAVMVIPAAHGVTRASSKSDDDPLLSSPDLSRSHPRAPPLS